MKPIMSIAVPLSRRGSSPKRALPSSPPVLEEMGQPQPEPKLAGNPRPKRPLAPQAQPHHRFRLGERLRMMNGGKTMQRAEAYCKVTAILPYEGKGALLYRVRSEMEQFERVVAEADLTTLNNLDGEA